MSTGDIYRAVCSVSKMKNFETKMQNNSLRAITSIKYQFTFLVVTYLYIMYIDN